MRRPPPGAMPAVLSATGFGLLLWLGVSVALLPHGTGMAALRAPQMWALIMGLALLAAAAACAVAARGARGLLHADTPWQRRRNLLVAIAVLLAVATGVLLIPGVGGSARGLALGFAGMSLAAASLGAVAAAAVAEVSPAPRAELPPLAVPSRLLSAMLTGLALMFALLSGLLSASGGGPRMLTILLLLGVLASLVLWLDARQAGASRDRSRPAWLPPLLLAGAPALSLALATAGLGGATAWLWLVAICALAGALLGWPPTATREPAGT